MADTCVAGNTARSVSGRPHSELSSRIAVQKPAIAEHRSRSQWFAATARLHRRTARSRTDRGMVASSITVRFVGGNLLAQLAGKESLAAIDRVAADRVEDIVEKVRATRGSKTTGTFCVLLSARPSRRNARSAARRPTSSGSLECIHTPRDAEPEIAFHRAVLLRDRHGRNRATAAAIAVQKSE